MSYLDIAAAALRELRERPSTPSPASPPSNDELFDAFPDMTLDDFATAGLVAEVYSEILGQAVLFVSDNVPDHRIDARGRAVYRASELRKLESLRPSPSHLKSIHAVKDIFGGSVVEVKDQPSDDESA